MLEPGIGDLGLSEAQGGQLREAAKGFEAVVADETLRKIQVLQSNEVGEMMSVNGGDFRTTEIQLAQFHECTDRFEAGSVSFV